VENDITKMGIVNCRQNALNLPKGNFVYVRDFTDFDSSVFKNKFIAQSISSYVLPVDGNSKHPSSSTEVTLV
jgi:hypothetical protein